MAVTFTVPLKALNGFTEDAQREFSTLVDTSGDCWEWQGPTNGNGYGRLRIHNYTSRYIYAHRYSWEATFGPVPVGLGILHRCNNKLCVRPDHLYAGTQADNLVDVFRVSQGAQNILMANEVRGIKGALKFTKLSIKKLAEMFNVSYHTIWAIKVNRNWAWLSIEEGEYA